MLKSLISTLSSLALLCAMPAGVHAQNKPQPQRGSTANLDQDNCGAVATPERDSAIHIGHNNQIKSVDWKRLFNQILVWNIDKNSYGEGENESQDKSAAGIRKYKEQLKFYSLYYSPKQFNNTYREIVGVPDKLTVSAQKKREELLSYVNNKCFLTNKTAEIVKQIDEMGNAQASMLIRKLSEARLKPVSLQKDNYFQTAAGIAVREALKDYIFVVVPGFGSHTIPIYTFSEIVEDANLAHGRPALRPFEDVQVGNKKVKRYLDPVNFYASGPQGGFDIVHPMGDELGFSMGSDKDSADRMADWIRRLGKANPEYDSKKLILVGYSKGTPIAHNMVRNHPDIQKRTALILTLAGVNQGAIPAEDGLTSILQLGPGKDFSEELSRLENNGAADITAQAGSALFSLGVLLKENSVFDRLKNDSSFLKNFMGSPAGQNVKTAEEAANKMANSLDTKDFPKVLNGIVDMSIYKRLLWNLVNMDDSNFTNPINIMNLSVLTNIDDFALPTIVNSQSATPMPLTHPFFLLGGTIDNLRFSQDNVFLFLTSLDGFKRASGGLFDTQVGWFDTKSVVLDQRPIRNSFRKADAGEPEVQALAKDILKARPDLVAKGLDQAQLVQLFKTIPRKDLIQKINSMKNFNILDLGELRGTHWDVSFRQVYFSPGPHYEHRFPRKAAMESFLETAGIYLSVVGGAK